MFKHSLEAQHCLVESVIRFIVLVPGVMMYRPFVFPYSKWSVQDGVTITDKEPVVYCFVLEEFKELLIYPVLAISPFMRMRRQYLLICPVMDGKVQAL